MIRLEMFKQHIDDPDEFAMLIDIAVQDVYHNRVPSIPALIDYLMTDEDEVPA